MKKMFWQMVLAISLVFLGFLQFATIHPRATKMAEIAFWLALISFIISIIILIREKRKTMKGK